LHNNLLKTLLKLSLLASYKYLWVNRARFNSFSFISYKVWAKRIHSLPELVKRNYRRHKLTLKGASINETSEIGFVKIDGDLKKLSIGEYTFLGRVYMALHEEIKIGSRVCINDGVQILTASHDIQDPAWIHIKGKVIVKDYAWIATNAIILPNVTIGYGAVVGAGAIVAKSVPDFGIVVGNPAKLLNKSRVSELNYNPCEFLASNRAWLVG